MKWSEIRALYPNKFVLLKSLKDHVDGNYKYIDEVALINVIDDDIEASNLLVKCKGDTFVYHTVKEDLCMEIVNNRGCEISMYKMYKKLTYNELLHYFHKADTVEEKDFWGTLVQLRLKEEKMEELYQDNKKLKIKYRVNWQ